MTKWHHYEKEFKLGQREQNREEPPPDRTCKSCDTSEEGGHKMRLVPRALLYIAAQQIVCRRLHSQLRIFQSSGTN